jgi:hypothetical protein
LVPRRRGAAPAAGGNNAFSPERHFSESDLYQVAIAYRHCKGEELHKAVVAIIDRRMDRVAVATGQSDQGPLSWGP